MMQQLHQACTWLPHKYTKHGKQDMEDAQKANFKHKKKSTANIG